MYNKRKIGLKYENEVRMFLEKEGYKILCTNFFSKFGEIDIIAKEDSIYVFIEVKYRSSILCGYGEEAVDYRKQKRMYYGAMYYLHKYGIAQETPCRFDVIAVNDGKISHIKNAFGGI
ncbi:MAG: YraN family protein [Lachnospiraceae bacterium]|nr:YraN family protein [Lachnospiraceae bacterium]